MSKKGELTTQQIIILIVLLISFIVILYFLFRLNIGKSSEEEICHNSIVMKGNPILSKGDVSINCKRAYVCLSKDGSCEAMTNPEIKKVGDNPEETYKVLADEMAGCWWMFGEGKINYVGKDFKENFYCSICSQLAFDNSLSDIEEFNESLDERVFYKYLEENEISEGQTYLNYLGLNSVEQIEETLSQEGGSFGTFEFSKQYFIMTGIYSEVGVWKWVAGLAAVGAVAGGIVATPFTGGASAIGGVVFAKAVLLGSISLGAVAGGFAGEYLGTAVSGDGVDNDFLSPVILEANSEEFAAFNCKDIMSLA